MENKHVMLDIETLSTQMNAVVLSIGALVFDPFTGEIGEKFYVELDLDEQPSRHISMGTLRFWTSQIQKDPTKGAIIVGADKAPVSHALTLLKKFIERNTRGKLEALWACDPDFDCAILRNLYAEHNRETPWAFYQPKSVRTIRMLAKQFATESTAATVAVTVTHNALEDCERQANEVIVFYRALAGNKVLCEN